MCQPNGVEVTNKMKVIYRDFALVLRLRCKNGPPIFPATDCQRKSYLEDVRAEIFQFGREMTGEIEIALDDLAVHMLLVLGVKWNVTGRHLKDEHAHRPPIHGLAVSAIAYHLIVV